MFYFFVIQALYISTYAAPSNTPVITATVSDDAVMTESGLFGSLVINRSPVDFDPDSQTSGSASVALSAADTVRLTIDNGLRTDPTNISINVNLESLGSGKVLTGGNGLGPITSVSNGGGGAALEVVTDADVHTNITVESDAIGGQGAFGVDSSIANGVAGSGQNNASALFLNILAGTNPALFTENIVNIAGNLTGGAGGNGGNSTFATGSGGAGGNGNEAVLATIFQNTATHFVIAGNLTGGTGGNGGTTTGSGISGVGGNGGEAFYLSAPGQNSSVVFDVGKSINGDIVPVIIKGGNGGTSPSNPGGLGSYRAGVL
ncbi:hypothetical protein DA717_08175 [Piscirickettsiaceae bacterium NZ-RLO2]|nr:hypothetical protein DA717_08175 [Piscirickettsiaceae bacterium NZ-RLO2]